MLPCLTGFLLFQCFQFLVLNSKLENANPKVEVVIFVTEDQREEVDFVLCHSVISFMFCLRQHEFNV